MLILSLLGLMAYTVVSLVLGVRLLLSYRRTGQLLELLMGIMFLVAGGVANTLGWMMRMPVLTGRYHFWAFVVRACLMTGCVAMAVAAWRVFRPNAPWAGFLVGVLWTMGLPYLLPEQLLGLPVRSLADMRELSSHPLYLGGTAAGVVANLWMAWESFQMQSLIRRRWRLGMGGDLVLAERMRFWGLGAMFKGLMYATLIAFTRVYAYTPFHRFLSALVISIFGLLCSLSLWLAFFPPRAYLARIAARRPPQAA